MGCSCYVDQLQYFEQVLEFNTLGKQIYAQSIGLLSNL